MSLKVYICTNMNLISFAGTAGRKYNKRVRHRVSRIEAKRECADQLMDHIEEVESTKYDKYEDLSQYEYDRVFNDDAAAEYDNWLLTENGGTGWKQCRSCHRYKMHSSPDETVCDNCVNLRECIADDLYNDYLYEPHDMMCAKCNKWKDHESWVSDMCKDCTRATAINEQYELNPM